MTLREISIGRDKTSDIYLDDRCVYASSHHGTIYFDGRQMMYRDMSSNGTMINNVSVRKRAVPINRGDIIMIAGQYQISWTQIDQFFPPQAQQQAFQDPQTPAYSTTPHNATPNNLAPDLSKWNWGAFGLYPIWGFFNGCWWAFFVGMLAALLWFFVPFIGWLLYPIPNVIFGVYGTRWAWDNGTWMGTDDFLRTQHSWGIAGIIVFAINALFWLFSIFFVLAFFSSF